MKLSITELKAKLQKPAKSKKERWAWFVGLYAVALITIVLFTTALHGLVALLIAV